MSRLSIMLICMVLDKRQHYFVLVSNVMNIPECVLHTQKENTTSETLIRVVLREVYMKWSQSCSDVRQHCVFKILISQSKQKWSCHRDKDSLWQTVVAITAFRISLPRFVCPSFFSLSQLMSCTQPVPALYLSSSARLVYPSCLLTCPAQPACPVVSLTSLDRCCRTFTCL